MTSEMMIAWIGVGLNSLLVVGGVITYLVRNGKYEEKVDQLEKKELELSAEMKAIRSSLDFLMGSLSVKKPVNEKMVTRKSPLQLSEYGKKIVKDSGFDKIFEQYKNVFADKLNLLNPTTKYDIQDKSRFIMDRFMQFDAFTPIKTYAFENGEDYESIIRDAGSILLRDYYFSIHPEIKE